MQRRVRCVCRIDYADLSPPGVGTGFLVGPDLVLTNWHVVRRIQEAPGGNKPRIAKELRFRFDLLERADAVEARGRPTRAKLDNGSPVVAHQPRGRKWRSGRRRRAGHGRARLCSQSGLAEPVGDDAGVGGKSGETRGPYAAQHLDAENLCQSLRLWCCSIRCGGNCSLQSAK